MQNNFSRRFWSFKIAWFIPIFGIALFLILYFTAILYYPGGSQINRNSVGFSWADNYWCNLLIEHAINGQFNLAKPIAVSAMVVLCFSLSWFWLLFPIATEANTGMRLLIQGSGILSMIGACFLFESKLDHDLIIVKYSIKSIHL